MKIQLIARLIPCLLVVMQCSPNEKPGKNNSTASPADTLGMVWIPGGTFSMGATNEQAEADEFPRHEVTVDGFRMDRHDAYQLAKTSGASVNPSGPKNPLDPAEPTIPKRTMRGGSFLCNDDYCSGYRVSRRMRSSMDSGLNHTGFRCVQEVEE